MKYLEQVTTIFQSEHLHIPSRTIFLGHETNDEVFERFIKNIHHLEFLSHEPIIIKTNNIGGEETVGMAMYDLIKNSPCNITIEVHGAAMSMGSIILQAADRRLINKHGRVMIHYGTMIMAGAEARTQYKWVEESKKFDGIMEQLYLEKIKEKQPDFTIGQLRKLLAHDTILDPDQALDLGLIDGIISK